MMRLLARLGNWLVRRFGAMTLLRVALLIAIGICAGAGMAGMVKQLPAKWMAWTAVCAVVLGWLLARSRLAGWRSGLIALFTGLIGLLLTVGQLRSPLGKIFSAWFEWMSQVLRLRFHTSIVDFSPVTSAWVSFADAVTALFTRIAGWGQAVLGGSLAFDPLASALVWTFAIWLLCIWAAWAVRRRGWTLAALLPMLVLLAYNIYFTASEKSIFSLIFFGGLALSLHAANGLASASTRWAQNKIPEASIHVENILAISLTAGVLMLVAVLTPSISVKDIQRVINEITHPRYKPGLGESLGLEPTPVSIPGRGGVGGLSGLSSSHLVEGGRENTRDVVMYIRVDGYNPQPPGVISEYIPIDRPPNFYWRSVTLPIYNGHGWSAIPATATEFEPGQPLLPQLVADSQAGYRLVSQHVEMQMTTSGNLFHTGELLSAEPGYRAIFLSSGDLFGAQISADTYSAESRLPNMSVTKLRAAGTDYPDIIRQRYLQLPEAVPQRVRTLALEITAAQSNPYDQAAAIENYLHENIPYTLDVPAPPPDREVADYFLFDLEKGYCDYYATTMVVLARAAGIPARFVTGFASGEYDPAAARFVVRMVNAHSWVEVYFPGYGWVEFEPTGNMPPIERPGEDLPSAQQAAALSPSEQADGTGNFQIDPIFIAFVGLLALLPLYWIASRVLHLDERRLMRLPASQAINIIYRRLYREGRFWNLGQDPARTPGQFAEALCERIRPLADRQTMGRPVQAIMQSTRLLADLYQRDVYGPQPVTDAERRDAVRSWADLRRLLLQARWRKKLGR